MTTPPPRMAVLPDTPDSRLLVELTSHASDLSEASHTLVSAFEAGEGSELWLPLTSHAVTAYIRPFILSNVRRRLDEIPEIPAIPPALETLHRVIRQYRNTTIAHSESDLSMHLPVATLDSEGQGVIVMGVSIINQMPMAIAERFADLSAAMEDVVDQATQPVLERLRKWLKYMTPETISGWAQPDVTGAIDLDFSAARKRTSAPRFRTYWHMEPLPDHERFEN